MGNNLSPFTNKPKRRGLKKINVKRRELSLIISDYVSAVCAWRLLANCPVARKFNSRPKTNLPHQAGVHAPPSLKNSTLITRARRRIEFTQLRWKVSSGSLSVYIKWTKCWETLPPKSWINKAQRWLMRSCIFHNSRQAAALHCRGIKVCAGWAIKSPKCASKSKCICLLRKGPFR